MSDLRHRTVRVRRSPRIGVFLIIGAALGAVVALVLIAVSPPDPRLPTLQALGFIVLLLAPVGALLSGAVAVALDRRLERRARTVQAERTAGEDPDDAGVVDGPDPGATAAAPADREQ